MQKIRGKAVPQTKIKHLKINTVFKSDKSILKLIVAETQKGHYNIFVGTGVLETLIITIFCQCRYKNRLAY